MDLGTQSNYFQIFNNDFKISVVIFAVGLGIFKNKNITSCTELF